MAIYQSEVTELPKKLAKSALYLCCNYSAFWAKCQLFVSKLCTPPQPGQNRAKQGQNRAFLGIFRAFLGPFRAGSVTILSSFWHKFFCRFCPTPPKRRARPFPGRPNFGDLGCIVGSASVAFRQSRPVDSAPPPLSEFGHLGQTRTAVSVRFPQPRPASPPHFWLF